MLVFVILPRLIELVEHPFSDVLLFIFLVLVLIRVYDSDGFGIGFLHKFSIFFSRTFQIFLTLTWSGFNNSDKLVPGHSLSFPRSSFKVANKVIKLFLVLFFFAQFFRFAFISENPPSKEIYRYRQFKLIGCLSSQLLFLLLLIPYLLDLRKLQSS